MGSLQPEKKHDRVAQPKGRELGPSFKRAQAKREHLKVALLAERHARGPDGQRMRFAATGTVLARHCTCPGGLPAFPASTPVMFA